MLIVGLVVGGWVVVAIVLAVLWTGMGRAAQTSDGDELVHAEAERLRVLPGGADGGAAVPAPALTLITPSTAVSGG